MNRNDQFGIDLETSIGMFCEGHTQLFSNLRSMGIGKGYCWDPKGSPQISLP